MKRTLISLCVAGLFAGGTTVALAADDPAEVKSQENQAETSQSRSAQPNQKKELNDRDVSDEKTAADFRKADKDNDGTLDRKEARKMRSVSRNFDAIDVDKDGTVSMDEINTYMAAHPDGKGKM